MEAAREIKSLTDSVISNREPNSRAGFAYTLGSILYYMGGMAAGLHLRTVLGLLLSLANDPHPTVHFWALEAMEKTITSSGLSFSPHVLSCLGAVSRLILSDLFDPEDVASSLSNAALECPTLASLVRCIDAIINVLGPDLASSKKSRGLICLLAREMDNDPDSIVSIEAIRCVQHLNLFSPDAVDMKRYVRRLENNLASDVHQLRQLSCEAIYGLIRKDVEMVFRIAQPTLPDELWSLLNVHGQTSTDVEEIISSWVEQTAVSGAKRWIQMCLKLLTHSGRRELLKGDPKVDAPGEPSEFIDEAAAFSAQSTSKGSYEETSTPYLRWQALSFALGCLRRVVELNLKDISANSTGPAHPLIIGVGDLIRVAFTASTSTVVDVRLGGLNLLHDLIKVTFIFTLLKFRDLPNALIPTSLRVLYLNNIKRRLALR
jgi:HEAT repeat-containing protein 5